MVYVVTYDSFIGLAEHLATPSRVIIVSKAMLESRAASVTKQFRSGLEQWIMLERALLVWRSELLEEGRFGTIVRVRTDMRLPSNFRFSDCIGRESQTGGIVYAISDYMFYSTPSVFVRLFSSFLSM